MSLTVLATTCTAQSTAQRVTNAQMTVSIAQQPVLPSVTYRTTTMRHSTTSTASPRFSISPLLAIAAPLVASLVSVFIIVTVFSTDVPYLTNGF
ncbi:MULTISPECIES: hypothetical protein [Burkholderia]|uniref:hypothetical protein n=1 Tax=Burkholderia TaxID=32008 RepID=UPI000F678A36|nr:MULTISPECIES: hypothetical protein [Burkholderia]MBG0881817.1 hypothetical protein [Burkholderia sp. 9775_39]MBG0888642.1 hypothetical protein [Burkholderia sp. 9773_38]